MDSFTLVTVTNKKGKDFLSVLHARGLPCAVLTNSKQEKLELEAMGETNIVLVDTGDRSSWGPPEIPIGKVFIFEESLPLTCRYLQAVKSWTHEPVYVVTGCGMIRNMYKELGAAYIIHSRNADVTFLIEESSK
ncbi:hypothetical protein FHS18_003661 [Paenibacillus phyllosphaerae]|uniref:Uncharacterized protein n=1 Tax=Paenibacillus phyllosphaerae TaxID=274593 RepID=A0A7W5AZH6_9BACL|nr:hypothetical protein [Paenibacillus phyllosphaerae]MBB3111593.1 hypothetical protein [Paenibacillus phyllosphaerae]